MGEEAQTIKAVQYYFSLEEYEQDMEEYKRIREAEALANAPEASSCKKVIKVGSKAKKEFKLREDQECAAWRRRLNAKWRIPNMDELD